MENERHVRLFRNGHNQAVRIPKDFELEGKEAILRKVGDCLIVEPVKKKGFSPYSLTWRTLKKCFLM